MNIQFLAFLQNLSAPELIIIFMIVLVLFGAKRLPGLFKSFGESIKEFKKATSDIENDVRNAMNAEDEPVRTPRAERKKVEAPKSDATESKQVEASTPEVEASTPEVEAPKTDATESKKEDA